MSVSRGFFITGTDTGVGKTVVAAGLVRLAASRGHRVVGLRLGCLNHARLTLEAIERMGRCRWVGWIGWIGNGIDPEFAHLDENLTTLGRLLGGPPLAVIPPLPIPHTDAVLEFLRRPRLVRTLGLPT